jgi:hypothetical protein
LPVGGPGEVLNRAEAEVLRQVVGADRPAWRKWVAVLTVGGALSLASVAAAAATVVFIGSPGTKPPPRRLDGVTMKKFARDHRRRDKLVSSITGPTGKIAFNFQAPHLVINRAGGKGYWKRWSNHYHGDVYYFATTVTLTLPRGTTAFYFYAEPNDPSKFKFTATSGAATSGPIRVSGLGGAKFFGFVAKGGATLTTVTVRSTDRTTKKDAGGFALGEFGIA